MIQATDHAGLKITYPPHTNLATDAPSRRGINLTYSALRSVFEVSWCLVRVVPILNGVVLSVIFTVWGLGY